MARNGSVSMIAIVSYIIDLFYSFDEIFKNKN